MSDVIWSGFLFRGLNIGSGILSAWCWGNVHFRKRSMGVWGMFLGFILDFTKTKWSGGILDTLGAEAAS